VSGAGESRGPVLFGARFADPSGVFIGNMKSRCLGLPAWPPKKKSTSPNALCLRSTRVQRGASVLRGTRMSVNAIVDNFDYGVSVAEISEQFEVPEDRIQAILTYAQSHRVAHPV
jgi:uncharacterized protein (DUF433 family)